MSIYSLIIGVRLRALFLVLAVLMWDSGGWAAPQGGQITQGSGRIEQSGSHTDIHQNSDFLATQWSSFNIAKHESAQAHQPRAASRLLIRVDGAGATNIAGRYTSNGITIIENQNGVQFSRGAVVNVGGLLATSARISGIETSRWQLNHARGDVINHGTITAGAGGAVLAAVRVENTGTITSTGGDVALGAGEAFTVDFAGGLVGFEVKTGAVGAALVNEGRVEAQGGIVKLTAQEAQAVRANVVSVGGVVKATKLERRGGVVYLSGGGEGINEVSAQVEADEKVETTGRYVAVKSAARIKASEILVGGDYKGGNAAVQNAQRTLVEPNALLDAGEKGRVIVWSDETTWFHGKIKAPNGFAEVSGKVNLAAVNLAGIDVGVDGALLLDPRRILIVERGPSSPPPGTATWSGPNQLTNLPIDSLLPGPQTLYINASLISAWTGGTLRLEATERLIVDFAITNTHNIDLTLRVTAGNIEVNQPINVVNGLLRLEASGLIEASSSPRLRGRIVYLTQGSQAFPDDPLFIFASSIQELVVTTSVVNSFESWMAVENRSLSMIANESAILVAREINIGSGTLSLSANHFLFQGNGKRLTAKEVHLSQTGAFSANPRFILADTVETLSLTTRTAQTVHPWMAVENRSLNLTVEGASITVGQEINIDSGTLSLSANSLLFLLGNKLTAKKVKLSQIGAFPANPSFILADTVGKLSLTTRTAQTIHPWMAVENRGLNLIVEGASITVGQDIHVGNDRDVRLQSSTIFFSGQRVLSGKNVRLLGAVAKTPSAPSNEPHTITFDAQRSLVLGGNIDWSGNEIIIRTEISEAGGIGVPSNGDRLTLTAKKATFEQNKRFDSAGLPLDLAVDELRLSTYSLSQSNQQEVHDWMIVAGRSLSLSSATDLIVGRDIDLGDAALELKAGRRGGGVLVFNDPFSLKARRVSLTHDHRFGNGVNSLNIVLDSAVESLSLTTDASNPQHVYPWMIVAGRTLSIDARNSDISVERDINVGSGTLSLSANNFLFQGSRKLLTAKEVKLSQNGAFPANPSFILAGIVETLSLTTRVAQTIHPWMAVENRGLNLIVEGASIKVGQDIHVGNDRDIRLESSTIFFTGQRVLSGKNVKLIGTGTSSTDLTIEARGTLVLQGSLDLGSGALNVQAQRIDVDSAITLAASTLNFKFTGENIFDLTRGVVYALDDPDTAPNEFESGRQRVTFDGATVFEFDALNQLCAERCTLGGVGNRAIEANKITAAGDVTLNAIGGILVFIGTGPLAINARSVEINANRFFITSHAVMINSTNGDLALNADLVAGAGDADVELTASGNLAINSDIRFETPAQSRRLVLRAATFSVGGSGTRRVRAGSVSLTITDPMAQSTAPAHTAGLSMTALTGGIKVQAELSFGTRPLALIVPSNRTIRLVADSKVTLTGGVIELQGDVIIAPLDDAVSTGNIELLASQDLTIIADGNLTIRGDINIGDEMLELVAGEGEAMEGSIIFSASTITARSIVLTQTSVFADNLFALADSVQSLTLTTSTSDPQSIHQWMTGNVDQTLSITAASAEIQIGRDIDTGLRDLHLTANIFRFTGTDTSRTLRGKSITLSSVKPTTSDVFIALELVALGSLTLEQGVNVGRRHGSIDFSARQIIFSRRDASFSAVSIRLAQDGAFDDDAPLNLETDLLILQTKVAQMIYPWMIAENRGLSLTSSGEITISDEIAAIDTGTGDLTLQGHLLKFTAARTFNGNNIAFSEVSAQGHNLTITALANLTINGDVNLGSGELQMTAGGRNNSLGGFMITTNTPTLTAAIVSLSQYDSFGDRLFDIASPSLTLFTHAHQTVHPWMFGASQDVSIESRRTLLFGIDLVVGSNIDITLTGRLGITFGSTGLTLNGRNITLNSEVTGQSLTVIAREKLELKANINFSNALTSSLVISGNSIVASLGVQLIATRISLIQNAAFNETISFEILTRDLTLAPGRVQQGVYPWMIADGRSLRIITGKTIVVDRDIDLGAGSLELSANEKVSLIGAVTLKGHHVQLSRVSSQNHDLTIVARGEVRLEEDINLGEGRLFLTAGADNMEGETNTDADETPESGNIVRIVFPGVETVTFTASQITLTQEDAFASVIPFILMTDRLILKTEATQEIHPAWMIVAGRDLSLTSAQEITINEDIDLGAGDLVLLGQAITFVAGRELRGGDVVLSAVSVEGHDLEVIARGVLTLREEIGLGAGDLTLSGTTIRVLGASDKARTLSGGSIALTGDLNIGDIDENDMFITGNFDLTIEAQSALTLTGDINVGTGTLELAAGASDQNDANLIANGHMLTAGTVSLEQDGAFADNLFTLSGEITSLSFITRTSGSQPLHSWMVSGTNRGLTLTATAAEVDIDRNIDTGSQSLSLFSRALRFSSADTSLTLRGASITINALSEVTANAAFALKLIASDHLTLNQGFDVGAGTLDFSASSFIFAENIILTASSVRFARDEAFSDTTFLTLVLKTDLLILQTKAAQMIYPWMIAENRGLSLTSSGEITISDEIAAIDTGTGDLTLQGHLLKFTAARTFNGNNIAFSEVSAQGHNLTITALANLTINGDVNLGSGELQMTAGGRNNSLGGFMITTNTPTLTAATVSLTQYDSFGDRLFDIASPSLTLSARSPQTVHHWMFGASQDVSIESHGVLLFGIDLAVGSNIDITLTGRLGITFGSTALTLRGRNITFNSEVTGKFLTVIADEKLELKSDINLSSDVSSSLVISAGSIVASSGIELNAKQISLHQDAAFDETVPFTISTLDLTLTPGAPQRVYLWMISAGRSLSIVTVKTIMIDRDIDVGAGDLTLDATEGILLSGSWTLKGHDIEINGVSSEIHDFTIEARGQVKLGGDIDLGEGQLFLTAGMEGTAGVLDTDVAEIGNIVHFLSAGVETPTLTASKIIFTQDGAFVLDLPFILVTNDLSLKTEAAQEIHPSWMIVAGRNFSLTSAQAITISQDIDLGGGDLALLGQTLTFAANRELRGGDVEISDVSVKGHNLTIVARGTLTLREDINLGAGDLVLLGQTLAFAANRELRGGDVVLSAVSVDGHDLEVIARGVLTLREDIGLGAGDLTLSGATIRVIGASDKARTLSGGSIALTGDLNIGDIDENDMFITGNFDLTIEAQSALTLTGDINVGTGTLELAAGASDQNDANLIANGHMLTAGTVSLEQDGAFADNLFTLSGEITSLSFITRTSGSQPLHSWMVSGTNRGLTLTATAAEVDIDRNIDTGSQSLSLFSRALRFSSADTSLTLRGASITINALSEVTANAAFALKLIASDHLTLNQGFDVGAGTLDFSASSFIFAENIILTASSVRFARDEAFSDTTFLTLVLKTDLLILQTKAAQMIYPWMIAENRGLSLTSSGEITISDEIAAIDTGTGDLTLQGHLLKFTAARTFNGNNIAFSEVSAQGHNLTITALANLTINGDVNLGSGELQMTAGGRNNSLGGFMITTNTPTLTAATVSLTQYDSFGDRLFDIASPSLTLSARSPQTVHHWMFGASQDVSIESHGVLLFGIDLAVGSNIDITLTGRLGITFGSTALTLRGRNITFNSEVTGKFLTVIADEKLELKSDINLSSDVSSSLVISAGSIVASSGIELNAKQISLHQDAAFDETVPFTISTLDLTLTPGAPQRVYLWMISAGRSLSIVTVKTIMIDRDIDVGAGDLTLDATEGILLSGSWTLKGHDIEINGVSSEIHDFTIEARGQVKLGGDIDLGEGQLFLTAGMEGTAGVLDTDVAEIGNIVHFLSAGVETPTLTASKIIFTQDGAFVLDLPFILVTNDLSLKTEAAQEIHPSWMIVAGRNFSLTSAQAITISQDIDLGGGDLALLGQTLTFAANRELRGGDVEISDVSVKGHNLTIVARGTLTLREDINLGAGALTLTAGHNSTQGNIVVADNKTLAAKTVSLTQKSVFEGDSFILNESVESLALTTDTDLTQPIHQWMADVENRSLTITAAAAEIEIGRDINTGTKGLTLRGRTLRFASADTTNTDTIRILRGKFISLHMGSAPIVEVGLDLKLEAEETLTLNRGFDVGARALDFSARRFDISGTQALIASSVRLEQEEAFDQNALFILTTDELIVKTQAAQDIHIWMIEDSDRSLSIISSSDVIVGRDITLAAGVNLEGSSITFTGMRAIHGDHISLTSTSALSPLPSDADLTIAAQRDLTIAAALNTGSGVLTLEAGRAAGKQAGATGTIIFNGNPVITAAEASLRQDGQFFVRAPAPARFRNTEGETMRPRGFFDGIDIFPAQLPDFSQYQWIDIDISSFFFDLEPADDARDIEAPQDIEVLRRITLSAPLGTITFAGIGAIRLSAPLIMLNARHVDLKGRDMTILAEEGSVTLNTNIINGGALNFSADIVAFAGQGVREVRGTAISLSIAAFNEVRSEGDVHLIAENVLAIAADFDLEHNLVLNGGAINFSQDRAVMLTAADISLTTKMPPVASGQNLTIMAMGHLIVDGEISTGTGDLFLYEAADEIFFSASSKLTAANLSLTQNALFESRASLVEWIVPGKISFVYIGMDIQTLYSWMIVPDQSLTVRSGGDLMILAAIDLGEGSLVLEAGYNHDSNDHKIIFADESEATIQAARIMLSADGTLNTNNRTLTLTATGDLNIDTDIDTGSGDIILTAGTDDGNGAIHFSAEQAVTLGGHNITLTANAPPTPGRHNLTIIAAGALVIDSDLHLSIDTQSHLSIEVSASAFTSEMIFLNTPLLTAPSITLTARELFGVLPENLFMMTTDDLTLIYVGVEGQRLHPWMVEPRRAFELRAGGEILVDGTHDFAAGDFTLVADGALHFTAATTLNAERITLSAARMPSRAAHVNISITASDELMIDTNINAGSGSIVLAAGTGAINFSETKTVQLMGADIDLTASAAPRASHQTLDILPTGVLMIGSSIDAGRGELNLGIADRTTAIIFTRDVALHSRFIIFNSMSTITTGGADLAIRAGQLFSNINNRDIDAGTGNLILAQGQGALFFSIGQTLTAKGITLEQNAYFEKDAPVRLVFTGENTSLSLLSSDRNTQLIHDWMVAPNRGLTLRAGNRIRIPQTFATLDLGTGSLELEAGFKTRSKGQIRFPTDVATTITAANITLTSDQVFAITQDITLTATGTLTVNTPLNTRRSLTLTGAVLFFGGGSSSSNLDVDGRHITLAAINVSTTSNRRSVRIRSRGNIDITGGLNVDTGRLTLIAGFGRGTGAINFITRATTILRGRDVTLIANEASAAHHQGLTITALRHIYILTNIDLGAGALILTAAAADNIEGAINFNRNRATTLHGRNISLSAASLARASHRSLVITAQDDLTINSSLNVGRGNLILIAGAGAGAGVGRLSLATSSSVQLLARYIRLEGEQEPMTEAAHDLTIRSSLNLDIYTDLKLTRDGSATLLLEAGLGRRLSGLVRVFGMRTFTADRIILRQDKEVFGTSAPAALRANELMLYSFRARRQLYHSWMSVDGRSLFLHARGDIMVSEDIALGAGDLTLSARRALILPRERSISLSGGNITLIPSSTIITNDQPLSVSALRALTIHRNIYVGVGDLTLKGESISFGGSSSSMLAVDGANIILNAARVEPTSLNRAVRIRARGDLQILGGFNTGTGDMVLTAGSGAARGAIHFTAATQLQGANISLFADAAPELSDHDLVITASRNLSIHSDINTGMGDLILTARRGAISFSRLRAIQLVGGEITLTALRAPRASNKAVTIMAMGHLNINTDINSGTGELILTAGVITGAVNFNTQRATRLTGRDITLTAAGESLASNQMLRVDAGQNINLNHNLNTGSGSLILNARRGAINFGAAHAIRLRGGDLTLSAARLSSVSPQSLALMALRHINIYTDLNTDAGALTLIAGANDPRGAIRFNRQRATTLSGGTLTLSASQSSSGRRALTLNASGDLMINVNLDVGRSSLTLSAGREIAFPPVLVGRRIILTKGGAPFTSAPPARFVGTTRFAVNYTGVARQVFYDWMVVDGQTVDVTAGGVLVINRDFNAGRGNLFLTANGGINFAGDVELRGNVIVLVSLSAPPPSQGDLVVRATGGLRLEGQFNTGSGDLSLEAGFGRGRRRGALNFGATQLHGTSITLIADRAPLASDHALAITALRHINIYTDINTGADALTLTAAMGDQEGAINFNRRRATTLTGGAINFIAAAMPIASHQNLTLNAGSDVNIGADLNLGAGNLKVDAARALTFAAEPVVIARNVLLKQANMFGSRNPLARASIGAERIELISTNSAPQTVEIIVLELQTNLLIRVGGDLNIDGDIILAGGQNLTLESGFGENVGAIHFTANTTLKARDISLHADGMPVKDHRNNFDANLMAEGHLNIRASLDTGSGALTLTAIRGAINYRARAVMLAGGTITLNALNRRRTPSAGHQALVITARDHLIVNTSINVGRGQLALTATSGVISFSGRHRLTAHGINLSQSGQVWSVNPFVAENDNGAAADITLSTNRIGFIYTGNSDDQAVQSWMLTRARRASVFVRSAGDLTIPMNLNLGSRRDLTLEAGMGDGMGALIFTAQLARGARTLNARNITLISQEAPSVPSVGDLIIRARRHLALTGQFTANGDLVLEAGAGSGRGQLSFGIGERSAPAGGATTLKGADITLIADSSPTLASDQVLIITASGDLNIGTDINTGEGDLSLRAGMDNITGAINFTSVRETLLNGHNITLTAATAARAPTTGSGRNLFITASGALIMNAAITLNARVRSGELRLIATGSSAISGSGALTARAIRLKQTAAWSSLNSLGGILLNSELIEFASTGALTIYPWMIDLAANTHLDIRAQGDLAVNLGDITLAENRNLMLVSGGAINFRTAGATTLRANDITLIAATVPAVSGQNLILEAHGHLNLGADINTGAGALTATAGMGSARGAINFIGARTLSGGAVILTAASAPSLASDQALVITAMGDLNLGTDLNTGEGALTIMAGMGSARGAINFIGARTLSGGAVILTAASAPSLASDQALVITAMGDLNLGTDLNTGEGALTIMAGMGSARGAINFTDDAILRANRVFLIADRAPASGNDFNVMISAVEILTVRADIDTGSGTLTLISNGALNFDTRRRALSMKGGVISLTGTRSNTGARDLAITAMGNLNIAVDLNTRRALRLTSISGAIMVTTSVLTARNIVLTQGQAFGREDPFGTAEMISSQIEFISTGTDAQNIHDWMVDLATGHLVVRASGGLIVNGVIRLGARRNLVLEAVSINFGTTQTTELNARLVSLNADQAPLVEGQENLTITARQLRLNTSINIGESILTINVNDQLILSRTHALTLAAGDISLRARSVLGSRGQNLSIFAQGDLTIATSLNVGGGALFLEAGHDVGVGVISFSRRSLRLTAANITLKQDGAPFVGGNTAPVRLVYTHALTFNYDGATDQLLQPWMHVRRLNKDLTLIAKGTLIINGNINVGRGDLTLSAEGAINFTGRRTLRSNDIMLASGAIMPIASNADLILRASGNIDIGMSMNVGNGVITLIAGGNISGNGTGVLVANQVQLVQSGAVSETSIFGMVSVGSLTITTGAAQAIHDWMIVEGMDLNLTSAGDIFIAGEHDLGADDLTLTAGGALNFTDSATLTAANITLNADEAPTASNHDLTVIARNALNVNTDIDTGSGALKLTGRAIHFDAERTTVLTGGEVVLTASEAPITSHQDLLIRATTLTLTQDTAIDVGRGVLAIDADMQVLNTAWLMALRFDFNFACATDRCKVYAPPMSP